MSFVDESPALYAVWVSLIMFCEGGHFTMVPNVLKKIFGGDYGTALYGIAFSYTSLSAVLIIFLQGLLLNDNPQSYIYFYYMNGACSAFALILLFTLFNEKPRTANRID